MPNLDPNDPMLETFSKVLIEVATCQYEKEHPRLPIGVYKSLRSQGIFCHRKFELATHFKSKLMSTFDSAKKYECPHCGAIVEIPRGAIVVNCRCGLPVFRPIRKQE